MPINTTQPAVTGQAAAGPEMLLIGRKALAKMFDISEATFARWDSSGMLGPRGHKRGGRKLWIMAEVRRWVEAGMPPRLEWLAE